MGKAGDAFDKMIEPFVQGAQTDYQVEQAKERFNAELDVLGVTTED